MADTERLPLRRAASPTQFTLPLEPQAAPAPTFTRHPRARRYIIRVADDGAVRVTIPRWGSRREAELFVEREHCWIVKQQQHAEEARAKYGRERPDGRGGREGRETLDARERAKRELPPRLVALAAEHGLPAERITRVSVRNQKWRWGSCSPDGHICLNWRLVLMPDSVRDYVMIHELMHLKRMDHSPRFWKLVAQACPDYQDARRYLRSMPRLS